MAITTCMPLRATYFSVHDLFQVLSRVRVGETVGGIHLVDGLVVLAFDIVVRKELENKRSDPNAIACLQEVLLD